MIPIKIVRFEGEIGPQYGVLTDNEIRGLAVSPFNEQWDIRAPVFDGTSYPAGEVELLVPCEPTKYIGVGLNFSSAAKAIGRECPAYPITFIKPLDAVIATHEEIVLPRDEDCFCYEGEMAVVIGRRAKGVSAEHAKEYILGCTCSNDVTDMGSFGKDDLKMKGADTFGPVGPCISTDVDPDNCVIRSWLNGELRQEGNTNEMKFSVSHMIELLSSYMTLQPGDVISMGTPAGLGHIRPGDQICVEVEGVGRLANGVRLET